MSMRASGDLVPCPGEPKGAAMSDKTYWFTAAVFPEVKSLEVALVALRNHVLPEKLLILADRETDISSVLDIYQPGGVAIATLEDSAEGWSYALQGGSSLCCGLRELLDGANAEGSVAPPVANGRSKPSLYTQLRRDARDGLNILVANVENPGEQLSVARIFLRQNAERVLMHEIAAQAC
jgi:hypothetical protein